MLQCFFRRLGFLHGFHVFLRFDSARPPKQQRFRPTLLHPAGLIAWISLLAREASTYALSGNVGDCHAQQKVNFWVRDRSVDKVNGYILGSLLGFAVV